MELSWTLLIIQALVFAGFCSFVAKEKNRDSFSWFLLGLLFSVIAMLALIAVPIIEETTGSIDIAARQQPPQKPPQKAKVTSDGHWECRCGKVNSSSVELCTKCGRSPNAVI